MRDPKRIEKVLDVLRKLWLTSPDLRLGQIMVNMTDVPNEEVHQQLFYMEDDELERRIKDFHVRFYSEG